MKKTVAIAIIAWLGTACGPSINKAYKRGVDELLAQHPDRSETVAAPTELTPQPWTVGQWALYKVTDQYGSGYERLSVVAEDECGIWVETVRLTYTQKSVTKVCYERMPWDQDPDVAVAQAIDLVQVMITKNDDNEPQVIDFRSEQGASMKMLMGSMVKSMYFEWWLDVDRPRETIVVPAGSFEDTIRVKVTVSLGFISVKSTGWAHPAVPVNGSVKVVSKDYTSELLAFGQEGAKTELPDHGGQ